MISVRGKTWQRYCAPRRHKKSFWRFSETFCLCSGHKICVCHECCTPVASLEATHWVSWLSFDVWQAWIRAIRTALKLCSNRWLKIEVTARQKSALSRCGRAAHLLHVGLVERLTNVSESIEARYWVSWLSFDVQQAWIRSMKTALEFVILCGNRWPKIEVTARQMNAFPRCRARCVC